MRSPSKKALGCPVLNLQERLRVLETHFNGTLAAEDQSMFQSVPLLYLPGGTLGLQALQAQITQVRTRQEHLLRKVDNFTRSPGSAPSPLHQDSSGDGKEGLRVHGKWILGSKSPSLARRAFQNPGAQGKE